MLTIRDRYPCGSITEPRPNRDGKPSLQRSYHCGFECHLPITYETKEEFHFMNQAFDLMHHLYHGLVYEVVP